jgi:hypothetical protein
MLVAIFLFNIAGYYMGFLCMKYSIKSEIYTRAINNQNDDELTLIKIPIKNQKSLDFKLIEDNEFIYKGEYYDVVKKKVVNDSVYYYCFNDSKETSLWDNLDKHIKVHNDLNTTHQKKNQNIIKSMVKELFIDKDHIQLYLYSQDLKFYSHKDKKHLLHYEVLTPPPQFYIENHT